MADLDVPHYDERTRGDIRMTSIYTRMAAMSLKVRVYPQDLIVCLNRSHCLTTYLRGLLVRRRVNKTE